MFSVPFYVSSTIKRAGWNFFSLLLLTSRREIFIYYLHENCSEIVKRACSFNRYLRAGMQQAGGPGGPRPPQILADQKAPPGSGGAPHYYRPPRIFDPWCIPDGKLYSLTSSKGRFFPRNYKFTNRCPIHLQFEHVLIKSVWFFTR